MRWLVLGASSPAVCSSRGCGSTLISAQGVDPAKPPAALPHAFRLRGTVEGSIAIRNLADMRESDTELTRYTAAKVTPQSVV